MKIYEDFFDDVNPGEAIMNDAPDNYQDDPTEMFYVRLGVFNTPPRFFKTLEFFLRFAEDCPFVEHPNVCAYALKDDNLHFERHDITTLQQKREFMSFYEKIWQDRPNGTVRLEFVQKNVSLKLFVLWLKKIGHFLHSSCMGESFYIDSDASDDVYRWKVGTEPFFDNKLIVDIYENMFPGVVIDKKAAVQTVIDGLAGMHRVPGCPYFTTLCYIRRYPDMFRGYKIETFGIYNQRDSKDVQMMTFLKVKKDDDQMTVDECIEFWDKHFVSKLTDSDKITIRDESSSFDVVVVCDDMTIKNSEETCGVKIIPVDDKEIRIIAVDRNLVPLNPEYRNSQNAGGELISEKQFSIAKREFNNIYERWRLCVIS